MFTGVGGFELGIGNRAKCIGFSEIDKFSSELLKQKFPTIKNYGDATKINPNELPDFDMLCGGFPCQAFSIAGKRKGMEDTRGTLFFEIARITKIKRPKYLFLENVKGLLSHETGETKTFKIIGDTFEELVYEIQWMVLNSKFFGVPQNRERIFIIGNLRGESRPKILPFGESSGGNNEKQLSREETLGSRENIQDPKNRGGCAVLTPDRPEKRQNGRRMKEEGEPSFTLTGQDVHGVMTQVHNMQPRNPDRPSLTKECPCGSGKLYQKCCGVPAGSGHLSREDTSYTVDGANSNAVEFNDTKIRRLTPIECERLQGFPDNWTEGFSNTQRYKMMGNAVTVNVIRAIASKLLQKKQLIPL